MIVVVMVVIGKPNAFSQDDGVDENDGEHSHE